MTSSQKTLQLPKAQIIEGLPYGNLGESALVYRGTMEGVEGEVALKVSFLPGDERRRYWEHEVEVSRELSELLPNCAAYHSMVWVERQADHPAFGMEIVWGYPILDRNIDMYQKRRFRGLLSGRSVAQLQENLELAVAARWHPVDVQYFVLLSDQTIGGRAHQRGDIILFDFPEWEKQNGKEFDLAQAVRNLRGLVS